MLSSDAEYKDEGTCADDEITRMSQDRVSMCSSTTSCPRSSPRIAKGDMRKWKFVPGG